ncbi:MAG: DUF1648 domain-containing protein [Chloroflexota bacterium]
MRNIWQKLSRCYPLQVELIPIFLLLLTIYSTFASYPGLPDTIPMHFNSRGIPDGWGSRGSIFLFPALGFFLYVLLTISTVLLAVSRDPRRFINIPRKWKEGLTELQTERLRLFLCRSLLGMKLLIQGLVYYLLYGTIAVALGRAEGLGGLLLPIIGAILAVDGYMVWHSFRIIRRHDPA